jgi:hypothetical protein
VSNFLITEAEFGAWLAQFPPDEIVGYRRSTHGCPLAEACGQGKPSALQPEIFATTWAYPRGDVHDMPAWACAFRAAIDAWRTPAAVTAAEAIEILSRLGDDDE